RLGRGPYEVEVAAHADASVEHHHDGDRLDVVGEGRDLLQLAVVVHLELIAIEIRHEAAFGVRDRRIDRHRVGAGAERGLLLRGGEQPHRKGRRTDFRDDHFVDPGEVALAPRKTFPGRAFVALPSAITGTPLTSTYFIPTES